MYCPKCDMDFIEGVTVCSDCGSTLVDKETYFAQKAIEEEEAAKKAQEEIEEKKAAIKETIENMTEEDIEAAKERAQSVREMMQEPSVYVNEKDKYSDNQSSAIALLIVGILVAVGAVLMWVGVLPDLGIIMKIALTGFAVICLVGAYVSAKNAKKYKGEIANEENKEKEIMDAFLDKYTREDIEMAVPKGDHTEEELAIERMNYIQDKLSIENDIPDKAYAAMLAENLYDKLFED